jgi:hypothetical protein
LVKDGEGRGGWSVAVAVVGAGALCVSPLAAQAPALRGQVFDAPSGRPLPFSIVELDPGFPPRLSDGAGRLLFASLARGRYRLVVRHIGYAPLDSVLDVAPDSVPPPIHVALHRLGVSLPVVTVTETPGCRSPGPPNATVTPALAAVFEQVLNNARRFRLLADSFPHRLRRERTLYDVDGRGARVNRVDTLEQKVIESWQYRPGAIVGPGSGARSGETLVRLPGLEDFADSTFVHHHCFHLVGRDTLDGDTLIRLDFEPPGSLRETDVAGAVYLDSATFQIRFTVVRLTRPGRALRGVTALVARARFREVAPWLVVADRVRSVTQRRRPPGTALVDEQRLVDVLPLDPPRDPPPPSP